LKSFRDENYYELEYSSFFLSVFTLLTSTGLDKKFEDMSQTSGTPFVSGTKLNSTPTQMKKISPVFF